MQMVKQRRQKKILQGRLKTVLLMGGQNDRDFNKFNINRKEP
jgi:hypothetical protein